MNRLAVGRSAKAWQAQKVEKLGRYLIDALKKDYMQELSRVEKCPIAIRFLGTYVIVMGVSLWTCSSWIYKKSHLRVWMLKFW